MASVAASTAAEVQLPQLQQQQQQLQTVASNESEEEDDNDDDDTMDAVPAAPTTVASVTSTTAPDHQTSNDNDYYHLSGRNLLATNENRVHSFNIEDCVQGMPTQAPSRSMAPTTPPSSSLRA